MFKCIHKQDFRHYLITASVLMMSPTLFADNVKIYGRVQAEYVSLSIGNISNQLVDASGADNGSASVNPGFYQAGGVGAGTLGIKALENFDRKTSAHVVIELDIQGVDSNNFAYRQGYVGLKNTELGMIAIGRFNSPYKIAGGVKIDPFITTALQARGNGGMSGANGRINGHSGYISDAIRYRSPRFGDLTVEAALQPDDQSTSVTSDTANVNTPGGNANDFAIALNYHSGDLKLWTALAVDKNDSEDETSIKAGGQIKINRQFLSLQFENIKNATNSNGGIGLSAISDNANGTSAYGSTNSKGSIWFLGYQLHAGNNVIAVQTGKTAGGSGGMETQYYAFGVIHNFSKKTRVFTGYANSNSDNDALDRKVFTVGLSKIF